MWAILTNKFMYSLTSFVIILYLRCENSLCVCVFIYLCMYVCMYVCMSVWVRIRDACIKVKVNIFIFWILEVVMALFHVVLFFCGCFSKILNLAFRLDVVTVLLYVNLRFAFPSTACLNFLPLRRPSSCPGECILLGFLRKPCLQCVPCLCLSSMWACLIGE